MNSRSKPMCSEKNLSHFYVVHHKSHTDSPVSKAVKGGSPQWWIGAWDMALVSWQHSIVAVINTAYSIQHILNVTLSSLRELQIHFLVSSHYSVLERRYFAHTEGTVQEWLSTLVTVWLSESSALNICAVGSPGWQPLTQREDSDQLLNEPSLTA